MLPDFFTMLDCVCCSVELQKLSLSFEMRSGFCSVVVFFHWYLLTHPLIVNCQIIVNVNSDSIASEWWLNIGKRYFMQLGKRVRMYLVKPCFILIQSHFGGSRVKENISCKFGDKNSETGSSPKIPVKNSTQFLGLKR